MYRIKLTHIWGYRTYWMLGLLFLLGFTPTTALAGDVDIVFVVDESGSMGSVQTAVKANIEIVATGLITAGHDGNFGLVGFGSRAPHPLPTSSPGEPHIHTTITDLATFTLTLSGLVANGSFEPGFEATSLATSDDMNFRPNAGVCIVLISDEDADDDGADPDYKSQAIADLMDRDATFFGIVRTAFGDTDNHYGPIPSSLAAITGGEIFEISAFLADPEPVLEALTKTCVESLDQVSGRKFNDLNGNGVYDEGEPYLSGWQIVLVDEYGNIYMTTTDAMGHYAFNDLPPGTYTLYEISQPGWVQTAPIDGSYTITITQGEFIHNLDFGNKICEEGQPDLEITKSADSDVFAIGTNSFYTLTVTNVGDAPFVGTYTVSDTIPDGLTPVDATPPCVIAGQVVTCTVTGTLSPGESQTFYIEVVVTADAAPGVKNCATVETNNSTPNPDGSVDGNPNNNEDCVDTEVPDPPQVASDLGDAPDSTNHSGLDMPTYFGSVLAARFPTVYAATTGAPPGPIHWASTQDAWLGMNVSGERDADMFPDIDGTTNISSTNLMDRDRYDDGVDSTAINIPECGQTSFQYDVNVVDGPAQRRVNVWFDYNRDGDWEDTLRCQTSVGVISVTEWSVQNHIITVGDGYHTLTTPTFNAMGSLHPQNPMWMRITLSKSDAPPIPALADGRGPDSGYRFGETEDYYLYEYQKPDEDPPPQTECVDPPSDMVAWWTLDEASGSMSADRAMYANNGGHVGGPTPNSGKVDGALFFTGSNYVEVPDHDEIDFGQGDLSIDAWVKTTDSSGVKIIVDKRHEDSSSGTRGYSLYLYKGRVGFQLANGVGESGCGSYPEYSCTNYNSSVSVADGEWHLIAVTVDRNDENGLRFYVDGALIGTFNPMARNGSLNNNKPLRIGSRSSSATGHFQGGIDEVELFQRVLSADEIADIYNAGSAGKCKLPTTSSGNTSSSGTTFANDTKGFLPIINN